MTKNKKVVFRYIEGFEASDHQKILSCLAEDVVWDMPGFFHLSGKEEFDNEIENENFVGSPLLEITRLTEENNVVVAEGRVKSKMKSGELLDALFCDVFEFEDGKIKKLTTYLMNDDL
ncbi:nuclear transport factor 2 family protein [Aliifodinibius sp. S!AR15-10]|uniref:nuclear transport factor 2 family protein n=1 Tax=Aliifodinibius sp. S!AR15-10 TaxID=2950437 RepID=UPI0028556E33|nr:nuclear transport factor 2 family protein [Aliifodinibius sp. S!AR15-10]MDR8391381.1 nuclear transport factor 2 family protein [Aliifodinibius sp. S!AR15-10]